MKKLKRLWKKLPWWAEFGIIAGVAIGFLVFGAGIVWAIVAPIPAIGAFEHRKVAESTPLPPLTQAEKDEVLEGCLDQLMAIYPGAVIICAEPLPDERCGTIYGYRGGYHRMLGLVHRFLTLINTPGIDEDDE